MGLTFEQKFYNIPDMLVVTVPGINDYVYCIVEDTPENRELLLNDIDFKRGNRLVHYINADDFEEKVKNGFELLEEIKEENKKV